MGYLLSCLLLFLLLAQIILIIVNNCDAHIYLYRLDPPTHDSSPYSEDPHSFVCENPEFINSFRPLLMNSTLIISLNFFQ